MEDFVTRKMQACLVLIPMRKELESHHFHPQNKKKAVQAENKSFLEQSENSGYRGHFYSKN